MPICMRSEYVAVSIRFASGARRIIRHLLPSDLKCKREGDRLLIPVLDVSGASALLTSYGIPHSAGTTSFEQKSVARRIPYDLIGEIAILRSELYGDALEVMRRHPRVRSVYADLGVEGEERRRRILHLAGEDNPVTIYRENGITLKVDVSKVYFSPRLSTERMRVASLVSPGEIAIDMFSGVGPFAVLMAKAGAYVHAIDINPDAVDLIRENAAINGVEDRISPISGDALIEVTHLTARGICADRVVMNYPTDARRFLSVALNAITDGTIHYYEFVRRGCQTDVMDELVTMIRDDGFDVDVEMHKVRSVSPSKEQWAFYIRLSRGSRCHHLRDADF